MLYGTKRRNNNGQWGWGYYEHEFFDANKITVENQALGGMSSRTCDISQSYGRDVFAFPGRIGDYWRA